ncbi:MAG TPA: hypothetical protein DCQ51_03345 [Planktothrix sp. UBA8407]|nr:hypothetical protein [Planktothrix sp. UBA8407]HBK21722.1 hypothetical protein [Planktothrix sp. UBA10369]
MTKFSGVIKYGFYIFHGNFREFDQTINNYIEELYGQGINTFDLRNSDYQINKFLELKKEISRLLHNYLASWYSIKEHTYAAENSLDNQSLIEEIKKKRMEIFGDNPENTFTQELRNYIQHKDLPLIESQSSINFSLGEQDFDVNHSLHLDTNKLLDYKKWTQPSKQYLKDHPNQVPIQETIQKNFTDVKNFYDWLRPQITDIE